MSVDKVVRLSLMLAGVSSLAACNAVLGIEEPSDLELSGVGGQTVVVTPGSGGGSSTSGGMPMPMTDGGLPAMSNKGPYEWAQWPMPNPTSAGLPNAQSYDTNSFVGVVIDQVTGLQWQRAVDEKSYSWEDAISFCRDLTFGGGGWRLPTRIELVSLVDYTSPNPVIDMNAFPETPSDYFWTSSPFAGDATAAWNVNFKFSSGIVEKSDNNKPHRVRCVR
jgi:hypothetical protein